MEQYIEKFKTGQTVAARVHSLYSGRDYVVCTGIVERLTRTQIVVRNEHGNIMRFRMRDNRQMGNVDPMQYTTLINH